MLVYFGGALNERRYEERRGTEPLIVEEAFRLSTPEAAAWALLVVPPPPSLTERGPGLRPVVVDLVSAFLRAGVRPEPSTTAAVGMSYGAMLGCAFTLEEPRCRRLATLAGVGMADVAAAAPQDAVTGKAFRCFVNDGDPLSEQTRRFAALMRGAGRRVDVVERHGEHSFADFVANGSAAEAFRFAVGAR
jgi:pimeloyl-ACP methyl ester carboxylesterase